MIKFNVTKFFLNKLRNLRGIPKKINKLMNKKLMDEAQQIISDFKNDINNDSLRLERLKPATIKRKKKQGFKRATRPLVGLGTGSQRSYMNMLVVKKIKNGVVVSPSDATHWSGSITLKELFEIHESDAPRTKIPHRPALRNSLILHGVKDRLQKKKLGFVLDSGFDLKVEK